MNLVISRKEPPTMQWIATCPHDTVEVLSSELISLGIKAQEKLYRGVTFDCELETAYRAHLLLRTASRIQRVVARFEATDLRSIQTGLTEVRWQDWLRSHRAFIVRPALADRNAEKLGEEAVSTCVVESIQRGEFIKGPPRFNPSADDPITIIPFIRNGSCVLSIDTAGRALHKRGWRTGEHPAVLKETLAATILMLVGYTGDEPMIEGRMPVAHRLPIEYGLTREGQMRVFLTEPRVPLSTNEIERLLRPIPMGRKAWLFCWKEVGGIALGRILSLVATCQLHGVDPYTYFVDILQRIGTHRVHEVKLLTPRLWKENFASNPLRAPIDEYHRAQQPPPTG